MPAPFAALNARVNTAVRDRLSDAVATIGVAEVAGVFRNGYAEGLSGLAAGSAPSFGCLADDAPGIAVGDALSISGQSYTVASVEPDGAGWLVLILRRAA